MSNIKINDVPQRIQYAASNGQTQFTVPFPFFQNNYVYVWLNGVQIFQGGGAGEYVVTGAGSPSGGLVTFNTPAALDDIVTIEGIMPIDRTSIYSATISNLTGSDLNGDFNREVVMLQQLNTAMSFMQLQYAPWSLVSQDLNVTKDRYIPLLGANQVWRMNEDETAIEPFTLDSSPVPSNSYLITYGDDPGLENEQNLALLGSGILKQTVAGGFATLAIAIPGTDYLSPAMPLGTMAYQDANNVNISGGVANITAGQVASSPVFANDIVNKSYADSIAAGFIFKSACYATTTVDLDTTYDNGVSGVGATLTANNNGVLTVDGVNPPLLSRVCVTDQTNPAENGVYTVTDEGTVGTPFILTRATDFDSSVEIVPGSIVFIQNGTTYANTSFVETEVVLTVGTDPILFIQFSQQYPLSMGNGGTGANITPVNNSLVYSTASSMALIAPTNNGVLVYSAGGVPSSSTTLPSGLTIPGYAASGANADITSMAGLTGMISAPTGIFDSLANPLVLFNYQTTPVNYIRAFNSATGLPLGFAAEGSDPNVTFRINTQGDAPFAVVTEATNIPFEMYSGTSSQHLTRFSFANTSATRTVTFPDSDGTVAFTSSQGMVLISTATASGSAEITFTGLTGYTNYMLVWGSVRPSTNGAAFRLQCSINNGSSYLSGATSYFTQSASFVGTTTTAAATNLGATFIVLTGALNSTVGAVSCGSIILENLPLSSGVEQGVISTAQFTAASPNGLAGMNTWGRIPSSGGAIDAFRLFMSAGNVDTGTFYLYGMQ